MKRFLAGALALILAAMNTVQVFAYTYDSNVDAQTTWDGTNTDLPYRDYSIYDSSMSSNSSLGLKKVNVYNIGDMKAASSAKQAAPSVNEIAANSGDIINVNAASALYGKGRVVDHINTKQITVGDFEAIMWSFIISQFATPYEDNLNDVLSHSIFQQMINQDLEITSVPDSASSNVSWVDVFEPGTQVVDTVKFADVANTIKKNLSYRVLYDSSGQGQVTLYNFLTADLGDVFYIKDSEATFGSAESNLDVWNNRHHALTDYESEDVVVTEKLIPVYVQSNLTLIQNQLNLGSFLKGQAPLSGTASSVDGGEEASSGKIEPSFDTIIGQGSGTGTMGNNPMYIDSFGNICVYHDNKMKIVLCNAQNSLFTSRPDDDSENTTVMRMTNGSSVVNQEFSNLYEVELIDNDSDILPDIYDDESDEGTLVTNESMAVFSKPVLTTYSRTISAGGWNSDTQIHHTGTTIRNDYPGFLDFHREQQNSHGNQLILFRPPLFDTGQSTSSGGKSNVSGSLVYANNEQVYNTIDLKNGLFTNVKKFSLWDLVIPWWLQITNLSLNEGEVPSQRYYVHTDGWLAGIMTNNVNSDGNQAVKDSALELYWRNLGRYMGATTASGEDGVELDKTKSNSPWARMVSSKYKSWSSEDKREFEAGYLNIMNQLLFAGMGIDQDKMIEHSFVSADLGSDTEGNRNYTVGGALTYSFDFGQYWEIINEANAKDATIEDIRDGNIPNLNVDGRPEGQFLSGFLKPFNRVQWTVSEEDYEELKMIIDEWVSEHGDQYNLTTAEGWLRQHRDFSNYKPANTWIEEHASDVFTDTLYYQLRDTRISDAWVSYSSEEVAMIAYVWLNYYLPKSLFARTFIDGTYENSEMFLNFIDGYNVGVTDSEEDKKEADEAREENQRATKYDTAYIDGTNSVGWGTSQVIMGPYLEAHGDVTAEDVEYEFYPDTAPFPAVIDMVTVAEDGTYEHTITNHVTVNVYDLLMGLYRNTNTEANKIGDIAERGPEIPIVDKNEILYGLTAFLRNPGTTIISWLVSLLQGMHRSMANGRFGDFFNVGWVTNTSIWSTVFQYYFIVMVSCVAVASIYLFGNLLLNKKVGLWMTIRRVGTGFLLTMIPVLLINTMVYGLDALTKSQLATVTDKAATAESAALIAGLANSNADFEYNYHLFREQFDSLEDVLGKYGYQIPVSYYQSIDQFKYSNESWESTLRSTSWASNQTSPKWYDYRAFVPVQKDKYSQNLYYYFYDYIKWQFLQYAATTPSTGTSIRIQDRAKEYTFGTKLGQGEAADYDKIQESCLYDDEQVITEEMAKFIENLDELMLTSKGDYAVMMQDPNYIYGESFNEVQNEAWGNYYLEDMFGFGYLLTDVKQGSVSPTGEAVAETDPKNWEVSDELYKYPGWIRFRNHPALSSVLLTNTNEVAFKNQKAFIDSFDAGLKKDMKNQDVSRGGRVYGSCSSLYSQINYNKNLGSLKYTELEKTLADLTERTYERVNDFLRFFPADTPNEAYISLAALSATFEFTKEFGNYGLASVINPMEPTGYKADTVTLDSALKGIFARDINDILQSRELMYMIVDNANGAGIIPCIFIVIADVAAFVSLITRNILMTLIFCASVFCVIFNYMLRQRQRNRTLLGIGTQCAGLVLMHLIMVYGLSLITYFSIGAPSLWVDVIFSLILVLLFGVCAVVHIFMLRLVLKDFTNFGGNIIAQKLDNLRTKFTGMFKGRANFGDVSLRKMLKEQETNEKDPYNYNVRDNLQKLDNRASAIGGLNALEEYYTDSKGDFIDKMRMGRYAEAVIMRRGSRVKDSCRSTKVHERRAPNILRNSAHGSEVARGFEMGSDTRFAAGAEVTNPDRLHAAAKASTEIRDAKADKIERKAKSAKEKRRFSTGLSNLVPAGKDDMRAERETLTAVADRKMGEVASSITGRSGKKTPSTVKKQTGGRMIYKNVGGKTTATSSKVNSDRKKAIIAERAKAMSPAMKRRTNELRELKRRAG